VYFPILGEAGLFVNAKQVWYVVPIRRKSMPVPPKSETLQKPIETRKPKATVDILSKAAKQEGLIQLPL
jgi:hypothetical protein